MAGGSYPYEYGHFKHKTTRFEKRGEGYIKDKVSEMEISNMIKNMRNIYVKT
jgi:hypothetical protein